jgi:predicted metallopeptidase
MTGLTITNIHTANIRASARIRGVDGVYYTVIQNAPIPFSDFLSISFERQVMKTGEILEVSIPSNTSSANHAHAHFSYIVNQREEFTII